MSQSHLISPRANERLARDVRKDAIQAVHAHSVALGARCHHNRPALDRRSALLRLFGLAHRIEQVRRELRGLAKRAAVIERMDQAPRFDRTWFERAAFNPDEPRDAWGRWTDSGTGAAGPRTTSHHHGPLSDLAHNPVVPAIYRPTKDRPIVTPTAGGGPEEREDLLEDFLDPTGELRAELFNHTYRALKEVDPVNPALEMVVPDSWVPRWKDIQDLNETLEAAKAARDMELSGEPPPDIWELGWGARGVEAERRRGASLPPNFPTIDKFEDGVVTSIKSIDLDAPSYQEPWQLEARINYYVNKLAAFDHENFNGINIMPEDIRWRTLDLIVPQGSLTSDRLETIWRSRLRAGKLGVNIIIIEY